MCTVLAAARGLPTVRLKAEPLHPQPYILTKMYMSFRKPKLRDGVKNLSAYLRWS